MDNRNISWTIWSRRYLKIKGAWLSCFVLSIFGLHARGQLQDQYISCFDYITGTALVTAKYSRPTYDNELTIEKCVAKCREQSETYSALQNGTLCHCVNDYDGIQQPDKVCSITCAGNQAQYCGGTTIGYDDSPVHSLSVVYAVCPIGNYSAACDKSCHCKRQSPCDRQTGRCPDGCDGNYTGSSCNMSTLVEQYIGCYQDNNDVRALPHRPYEYVQHNTIDKCRTACAVNDSSYAGAQLRGECFCGENYNKYKKLEEALCNTPCTGDLKTSCGGANANSVYSVCPVGRYGQGCRKKCNCLNDTRCVYVNGSCPSSQCKPGWTGDSCNIRDCTAYNGGCNQNETCSIADLKFTTLSLCRCSEGYQRRKIWENCTDKDECTEVDLVSVCGKNATNCTNTIGGYQCRCQDGQTRINKSCMTEMENDSAKKSSNVGAIIGSMFCVSVILAIIVLLYRYRNKWHRLCHKQPIYEHPGDHATDICLYDAGLVEGEQNTVYYSSSSVPRELSVQHLPNQIRQKMSIPSIIDKEFKRVPLEAKHACSVGKNRELRKKNRYRNIVPYDYNRVTLHKLNDNALSDYVNASYIKGYNASDKFIATQGPRPETVGDFWRMVWEREVGVIVMITDLVENRKVKCEKYWPNNGECEVFDGIAVKTGKEEIWNDFASRQIQVTKNSQTMNIKQWHFLSWPDHGVPLDADSFRNFHRRVRQSMGVGKYTIVHCSAGVGRTGCFFAIDFLLEQGNAEGKVDIFSCLRSLREQRIQMIQTAEQYRFVHTVLLRYYSTGDTTIEKDYFHKKFRELQQIDPESGRCKLDVQFNSLAETKENLAGISNKHPQVAMKSIEKNKLIEMDVAFVHGWKKKNTYITLKFPVPAVIQEFYALCKENRCKFIIVLDSDQASLDPIFPTKQNEISLRSHVVSCDRISAADYGTCYKLLERRRLDDTYANIEHLAVYANFGGEPDSREMYVFHLTKMLATDVIDPQNLIALYKDMCKLTTIGNDSPTVILSRGGYSLTAFCLAAFIAFDMIKDENEIDVYQIAQDIRKSKSQLELSLASYKALYTAVGQYIDDNICSV